MIAEAYRFASSHAYAKELINQGYIGDLKMLNITLFQGPTERPEPPQPRLHWRSNNATGGGFSQGPASTFFDSVIDWFGPVKSIRGTVYAQFPGGKQPDGSVADLMMTRSTRSEASWSTPSRWNWINRLSTIASTSSPGATACCWAAPTTTASTI